VWVIIVVCGDTITNAVINPRFRITIPKQVRKKSGLKVGDTITFLQKGEEIILIKTPEKPLSSMAGSIKTKKNIRKMLQQLKEEDLKTEDTGMV